MDDEQYINIEDGLSVGTMKIANKYEIFSEEEIKAINDKIPELDERVGVIEQDIVEINSSLDKKANINNSQKVYEIINSSFEGDDLKYKMNDIKFGCGIINLNSTIQYTKESKYYGSWWSYGGTIIRPTGDFSAFAPDTNQDINYTRNEFSSFMLDGKNLLEDTPILKLNKTFLTTFEKIFFINGGTIDITNSDSIRFIDCRFMDGVNKNIKINIGSGARSINFIGCNFENYNNYKCQINIDGGNINNTMTTNINFTNCQSERAEFIFNNCSNCVIDASKLHSTNIILGEFTNNIKVINVADSSSSIIDLGKDNVIENCVASNIAGFNISKYRLNSDFKATTNDYGNANKEYLFITSIFPNSHKNVTNGKIEYSNNDGEVLYTTNTFNLRTDMTTNGTGIRQSFTDMRVLKNPNGAIIINSVADSGASTINKNVIIKENLIIGGEFITTDTINSAWKFKNMTSEIVSNKLITTVTNNGQYCMYQTISGLDENKCYMGILNSDSKLQLVVGDAWNGTQGARNCLGATTQLSNGTYLSQVFITNKKKVNISIGNWSGISNTQFSINYIALIEI